MPYLNTNDKTARATSNERGEPMGRVNMLYGLFIGFVKSAADVQLNGRLRVWIPELGSEPSDETGWITVSYCSPFAGATNIETANKTNYAQFEGTQTSYGMWMIPPDINNEVMVMFINGDSSKGVWIGSLYNQFMNNMVPATASNVNNYQYQGQEIPAAEYNKWDKKTTLPDAATKPYSATKFKGLGNQGLIRDTERGITKTSARRESPSAVFGILTPGPVIDKNASPENVRRKGGSSFVMDDGQDSEYIQLETKSGAQIQIDETNGFIYMINRDGSAWVQMDQYGNIDIFGATNISMRAQRDINLRADRNINIEAGQNIFMKAAQDTKETVTEFTYDVNNVPNKKTIPVWAYVGQGNGQGGNIVMQSVNNIQSTAQKGIFMTTVENDLNIKIANTFNLQTVSGAQNFNSKQGIKMTTDAAFDLGTTGNIRVGSKGIISVVGEKINVCSDGGVDIKSNVAILGTIKANTVCIDGQLLGGGTISVSNADGALSAAPARPAEVKPLNEKVNILATWNDPESKFKRNSQSLQTTVSRFPTYEPCPEHEKFKTNTVVFPLPAVTPDDITYMGSSGAGNNQNTPPAAAVNAGANNISVLSDSPSDSYVATDMNMSAFRQQLILHEGRKNKSYADSLGLLTGGIGHLMRSNEIPSYPIGTPISDTQIETWYTQDSSSAIKIAQELCGPTWGEYSDIRKRAIADLSYNLGKSRLSKFSKFLAAMKAKDYNTAGKELRDSKWFDQVGKRGPNIITMVVQNVDPTSRRA